MLGSAKESISILQVIKNSTPLSPKVIRNFSSRPPKTPTPKKWPKEVAYEKYYNNY